MCHILEEQPPVVVVIRPILGAIIFANGLMVQRSLDVAQDLQWLRALNLVLRCVELLVHLTFPFLARLFGFFFFFVIVSQR